jgi:argininosuccinate synthase
MGNPSNGKASKSSSRKKVVLAYSGGLDTSVAIHWLKETKGLDVVTLTLDLGQENNDLKAIESKAKKIGAASTHTVDTKAEFANDYVKYAIWANALYGGKYPLATALGRPLIGKKLAEVALQENADFIAHGCTGKGNDQVRIEVSASALHGQLKTIAPMREWIYTRDEAVQYAEERGIPVPVKKGKAFSIDENLWGRSIESGPIEDATQEPPEEAFLWTASPADAPDAPEYVTIGFEKGTPVSLDGRKMGLVDLILKLNTLAGQHGVGRIDQIEDRLVGIKSREVYESPAAVTLLAAHRELEALALAKDVLQFKPVVEAKFAELTYNGLWFSPLMDALQTFLATTQERVTGEVKLKLYKGNLTVASRTSPFSLYDKSLATYGTGDAYDHTAAQGFIAIWGLPLKVWNKAGKKGERKEVAPSVR